MSATATTSPAGAEVAAGTTSPAGRRWYRWGWLMAAVWLVFLLDPLLPALRNPDRLAGGLAVAAILAFGAVFLWSLAFRDRRRDSYGWAMTQPPRRAWATLGVLAVLSALTFPGAGPDASATFVFLVVFAVFALPPRRALPVSLLVVVLCLLAPLVDPRLEELDATALSTALAGTTVFGVTATARRGRQLATAQQDLARLAVVAERARVGRDLHDLLGHSLTVVTLKAQLAARLAQSEDPAVRGRAVQEMEEVERLSRDALTDVRAALAGYREASLGTELAGARHALDAAGVEAHLPASVDEEVPADLREVFAWTVREGVTNVVRHSRAAHCWVELSATGVVVSDDGRGPAAGGADERCSGLTGLAHRAGEVGAVLSTGRSSAGGFRLAVTSRSAAGGGA